MVLGKAKAYKKKGRYLRRAGKNRRRGGKKSGLVSLIKRVMKGAAETKTTFQNLTVGFGSIQQSAVLNVKTISPSAGFMPIIQGTTQDERVGNKISTKKVTLRYTLNSNPYNATSNLAPCPMDVIIWIGRLKRTTASPTGLDFGSLFQYGSTSQIPSGDLSDLNASVNKDYFTILKKIVHKVGFSSYDGSGANIGAMYYQNNDYPYNVIRTIDVTKCFAKNYIFNDSDDDPMNSRTYIWFEAIRSDGIVGTAAAVPCLFRGTIDYQYTDV